jgi:hypothetical protein
MSEARAGRAGPAARNEAAPAARQLRGALPKSHLGMSARPRISAPNLLPATCRAAPHVTWRPRELDRARARSTAGAGEAGGHCRADRRGAGTAPLFVAVVRGGWRSGSMLAPGTYSRESPCGGLGGCGADDRICVQRERHWQCLRRADAIVRRLDAAPSLATVVIVSSLPENDSLGDLSDGVSRTAEGRCGTTAASTPAGAA